MILLIKTEGDRILREPVIDIIKGSEFMLNGKLQPLNVLIEAMFETMEKANGIGLAAPQVGISASLFVIDVEISTGVIFKKAFINPEIKDKFGAIISMEEGCLSIPGIHKNVSRYGSILLHYYDENWEKRFEFFHDMQARVIQHEYDHLNGILFTDYVHDK